MLIVHNDNDNAGDVEEDEEEKEEEKEEEEEDDDEEKEKEEEKEEEEELAELPREAVGPQALASAIGALPATGAKPLASAHLSHPHPSAPWR